MPGAKKYSRRKVQNINCQGDHCKWKFGVVKKVPCGGDSNLILCADCFEHEMKWRAERNRELGEQKFPIPLWLGLEVYKGA